MLVKAKWNVKDSAGWHEKGEVFQTKDDLGDAVTVLEDVKKREAAANVVRAAKAETEKPVAPAGETLVDLAEKAAEPEAEAEAPKQEEKPVQHQRSASRRRK